MTRTLLLLLGLLSWAPGVAAAEDPAAEDPAAEDPAAATEDDRVSALERRLAEVEGQLRGEAPKEALPPSVSGWGGVGVAGQSVVLDAVGLGGPVSVAGTVLGNAVGLGSDVHVTQGGRLDGHEVALGGEVLVEPGAQVQGERFALGIEEGAESAFALPLSGDLARYGRSLARRLALLLVFAAAGTLAIAVWPRQVDEVAERVTDRPFWYGIVGALLTASLSIGASLLSLTIIGIPVALLFLVVLGLAWLVGMAAVCRTAGRRLAFGRQRGDAAAYLVGAALVAALGMVPALGTIVVLIIGFPAVGAAVVSGLSTERRHRDW